MIKICHMTSCHKRNDIRIFEKECKSLSNAGYHVYLIVADGENNESKDGVDIISTQFIPKNRIDRILNANKGMLAEAQKIDASIYHLHDPELLKIALKLKKNGKIVIFDSHEDVPGQILGKQWIPRILRRLVSRSYSVYENYVIKRIDAVISVTPHLTKRLKAINSNTVQVTNYPILMAEVDTDPMNHTICFAGGIAEQWMHKRIIKALQNLKTVRYLLAGQGDNKYLEELRLMDGWKYVEYFGSVPYKEVWKLYGKASIGMALLNYSENMGGKLGTLGNTKLFEYMMAGLPVICTDFTLWKEIVERYQCGIFINPNDVDSIVKSIEYLIENPKLAKEMGRNGRKAVIEKYNWNTQREILLKAYEKLVNNSLLIK